MDTLTRRKFLTASGVAGAGALAAGATTIGIAELLSRGSSTPDPSRADKLVIVTLYGGNDGLNTVVPFGDPAYHKSRPGLAYAPDKVLHLNGALGLNPGLTGFKRQWDTGQLAIVLGVGYPKPDRSHFRSMDIWQTASPAHPTGTGWIGRWLDGTGAAPEDAVSLEPVLPPLLAGATRAGACISPAGMALPAGLGNDLVAVLGRTARGEPALQSRAATTYRDLLRVDQMVKDVDARTGHTAARTATPPGTDPSLAVQLDLVARCVEAGVPTRVFSVSLGGFDTHAEELDTQQHLLKTLDTALTAFLDRMADTDAGRRVAVLVYSEFGRRVYANASDGTDHGTAGPVFLLGAPVAGGFYGHQPSLTDLDEGDLKASTDFRDVFATVLDAVLHADPERYLPDYKPRTLPLFRRG